MDENLISQELLKTHQKMCADFNNRASNEFATGFTADCWQAMPGQNPRNGREQMLSSMENDSLLSGMDHDSKTRLYFDITCDDLRIFTETNAVERGSFTISSEPIDGRTASEGTTVETGYYLVVWQRGADRKWRVHWDIVQSNEFAVET